jgi:hypothetical protein
VLRCQHERCFLLSRFPDWRSLSRELMSTQTRQAAPHVANVQSTGKVDDIDESSHTNKSIGEVVSKIQLSLVIPAMRSRVRCELPLEAAPKPDLLSRWELAESWAVVSAEAMRALAFARSNVRPGEKPVGAMVVFHATEVRKSLPTARWRRRRTPARRRWPRARPLFTAVGPAVRTPINGSGSHS